LFTSFLRRKLNRIASSITGILGALVDMNLHYLKDALQMLALPITAQIHLDKNEVGRVERLRKLFRVGHRLLRTEMTDQLTLEQKAVLAQLDGYLLSMNSGLDWRVWSEETLRQNATWRQVRTYARKALIQFNWPLDLPSGNLCSDQPVNGKASLESQLAVSCSYT
jgi:hypothetical protein